MLYSHHHASHSHANRPPASELCAAEWCYTSTHQNMAWQPLCEMLNSNKQKIDAWQALPWLLFW